MPLYRDMDRVTLDVQYDARATTPDFPDIMHAYRARTDAAKALLGVETRAYGPGPAERLDIYPAAGQVPAPVLVFVHGGYWRMLDAADSGSMAPGFHAAGAVTVSVNYTLAPEADLDRIVAECRRALAWVHANIAAHGGDPSRLHVAGSSAGGHLAAMLTVPGWQAAHGLPDDVVKGAALLSGLHDLRPVALSRPNEWLRLDEAAVRRNSPALLPPPRPGLPVVVAWGETETAEFIRQSRDYAARLRAAGCAVEEVMPRAGSNHFDLVFDLGEPGNPLHEAVRRQMGLPRG